MMQAEGSCSMEIKINWFADAMDGMGVLAVRLQGLNRELEWNGEKMVFTNIGADDKVRLTISDNFTIVDGDPKFNRPNLTINAGEFASEMIKHTYRESWSLPDMQILLH